MKKNMGHKNWCIPDMYMAAPGDHATPSHECISFFCNGEKTAVVTVIAVFEDDIEKMIIGPIKIYPMSSKHLRMDRLEKWGIEIPREKPYSVYIESLENIVVEYARLNWIDGKIQSFGHIAYFEE